MGMSDKVDCADGRHCQRGLFEEWDLNHEGVCQGCEAVASYIEKLVEQKKKKDISQAIEELKALYCEVHRETNPPSAEQKDQAEPCPKCGSKTFLYDEHGDPVYCKECLNHVY